MFTVKILPQIGKTRESAEPMDASRSRAIMECVVCGERVIFYVNLCNGKKFRRTLEMVPFYSE